MILQFLMHRYYKLITIVIIFDSYLFTFIENMCTRTSINKLVVILIDIKVNHKDVNCIIIL